MDVERRLARRASLGDREALLALVRRHQDRVFRLAWLLLEDEAAASEAAAEAFARVGEWLRRGAARGPFVPLVARALVRVVRDERRRPPRRPASARFVGSGREAAAGVLAALRSLETVDAAALSLRYVLGASDADLMLALSWGRRELERRLTRAEGQLRRAMQERASVRRAPGEPPEEGDVREALSLLAAEAPAAPTHLVSRVERRMERPARGRFQPPRAMTVGLGVVAILAAGFGIAVGLLAASGAAREWLRVGPSEEPAVSPTLPPTPVPTPTPLAVRGFARPVTLAEARRLAAFPLMFPQGWPGPDAVYVWEPQPGNPVVILSYLDGGFDLYEGPLAATFDEPPAELARVAVGGAPARWLQGGAIVLHYVDVNGRPVVERKRILERNTLVWERSGVTLRMETSRALPFALAIAGAVR